MPNFKKNSGAMKSPYKMKGHALPGIKQRAPLKQPYTGAEPTNDADTYTEKDYQEFSNYAKATQEGVSGGGYSEYTKDSKQNYGLLQERVLDSKNNPWKTFDNMMGRYKEENP
tara:strand:- start:1176 stop:1514 length:339 start_codon:yes stop_codon:yes gene_type:complete